MQFVLVDQSTAPAPIDPAQLAAIASALEVQANRDAAPEWGGNVRVRAATPDAPPGAGEIVALIVDSLPDAPGAVAYHSWSGVPQIYAARSQTSSLTTGDGSLSQALSHEVLETMGDEGTNCWCDEGTGTELARELCDPVESGWYAINGIAVSDFVLRAYFDPGSAGPFHYLATVGQTTVTAPFQVAAGGYQIVRSSGAGEHQVTARFDATFTVGVSIPFGRRAAKKRHPSSRSFRRGLRLAP